MKIESQYFNIIVLALGLIANGKCLQAQWGLCLSDAAMGQYTLAWQAPKNDVGFWTLRGSFVQGTQSLNAAELGWSMDENGQFEKLAGSIDAQWRGWGFEAAFKKNHLPVYNGPEGVALGVNLRFRNVRSLVTEIIQSEILPSDVVFGSFGHGLISHESNMTFLSTGLELSYSKEVGERLIFEVFAVPSFQGVLRNYEGFDAVWKDESELTEFWRHRLNQAYSPSLTMKTMNLLSTGPWLRMGITLYM